jgi:hypothetical protein
MQGRPSVPSQHSPNTHVNYWWLIVTHTASLAGPAMCIWASPIIFVLLLVSVINLIRRGTLTRIGKLSFLLSIIIFLAASFYSLNAVWFDGTFVDHIHSIAFRDRVYQLAYEQDAGAPFFYGNFVIYSCQPPGLWCGKIASALVTVSSSTNLHEYGAFVTEQDKLYLKVGQNMIAISDK